MERALLQKILERTPGVESSDGTFVCEDEHRASILLGVRGGTNVLAELVRIQLHDDYLEAESKTRAIHCVGYEPVLGVTVQRPPKEAGRTGF